MENRVATTDGVNNDPHQRRTQVEIKSKKGGERIQGKKESKRKKPNSGKKKKTR